MADTIIKQPDPTASPTPTFTPTPAPVPAPASTANSPAPAAASPSASGLAAPGAALSSQSTAPAANGLAGATSAAPVSTPNPTTAGTTPNAAANEAVSTLAQPTPLPAAAQKTATPAGGGSGQGLPGANPVKNTAAGKSIADINKATAKATAAKTAPAGSVQQNALDALAPVDATIKSMIEGSDPIATIQYNQILNGTGPKNQAALSALGMKLAQNNLDGQGAGDALIAMMARDQDYDVGQLMGQVASDSAKRIADMNQWGFQKALDIKQAQDNQTRTDLTTALANGQLDTAAKLWGQVYPGIPFDTGAAKAANPQQTASFNSRMKLVDQYVAQGDATSAKQVMDQLASDMPEMFGFPNDPAAAKAAVAGIDYTTEAWQNTLKAQNDASAAARTAALQGDQATLSSSIDQLFSKMTPAAVESIATSAVNTRPLDEINKILTASGMAPVASTDEAKLLDKTKFAKAVKSYDMMQDSKKDIVDGLLDTFTNFDHAIATDPNARQAARAWLSMHAYNIATDPTSGAVTSFTLDDKATPPWDPSSPQAYMFLDWPAATFNADGSVAHRSYAGMTPYSADYKPGDLTSPKGREDARLDSAYEQYTFSTPADQRLSMEQWYYATAGGKNPPNPAVLTGQLGASVKAKADAAAAATKVDPMVAAQGVKDKISQGQTLTPDDINIAKTQGLITQKTSAGGGLADITNTGATQYLQQHPDGNLLLDGALVKVLGGSRYTSTYGGDYGTRHTDDVKIQYNGNTYWVDAGGNWYNQDPISLQRNGQLTPGTGAIQNPITAGQK